jgi:hypothetical protein
MAKGYSYPTKSKHGVVKPMSAMPGKSGPRNVKYKPHYAPSASSFGAGPNSKTMSATSPVPTSTKFGKQTFGALSYPGKEYKY